MNHFIELSHVIEDGMITYPGLPGPVITDHLSRTTSRARYGGLAEFQIGRIEMIANTGTYLDTPFHRYPDGADLADVPLHKSAALPGLLLDARGDRAIDVQHFDGLALEGRAVVLRTEWSRHWRTPTYIDAQHPFVTAAAAMHLAKAGAALVGIDSINIDDIADGSRPTHTTLLAAGIGIVEHLTNLQALEGKRFTFFAVAPRVRGVGSFPVRAFAMTEEA